MSALRAQDEGDPARIRQQAKRASRVVPSLPAARTEAIMTDLERSYLQWRESYPWVYERVRQLAEERLR